MLAISYPNALAVNPSTYGIARQGSDSAYLQYRDVAMMSSLNPIIGFDRFGHPIYASDVSMLSNCSPYGYGPYDIGWSSMYSYYGCSRFGYNGLYNGFGAYGYGGYGGYGYGGYGGYYGGVPVVLPQGKRRCSGGSARQSRERQGLLAGDQRFVQHGQHGAAVEQHGAGRFGFGGLEFGCRVERNHRPAAAYRSAEKALDFTEV